MSYLGREREVKLIVQSKSLTKISNLLEAAFESEMKGRSIGLSTDKFWKAPENSRADFLRIRDMSVATQITVKARDRGEPTNRLELEFLSQSKPKDIQQVITALLGKSIGSLGKTYYVYILENQDTTVSVYTLFDTEPEFNQVIIEVEARTEDRMLELEAKVLKVLADKEIEVRRAPGSLYEMFISKEKPL